MNCRANRTSQWKLRLIYELENWSDACFITLGYDEEHIGDNNLSKKEVQDYLKRLRYLLDEKFGHHVVTDSDGNILVKNGKEVQAPNKPIKYFFAGEYGDKHKRAHYHAIIFGLSPYNDVDRECIANAWLPRCASWQFDKFRGKKSAIGEVTADSIAYVAGYIQKKLVGKMAVDEYNGRQPPFQLSSQRLGLDFAVKNKERLNMTRCSYLNGSRIPLPRYFREKLEILPANASRSLSKRVFQEANEKLRTAFENETGACLTAFNQTQYMRHFEHWYDDYVTRYADILMADFIHRSKLRYGDF